MHRNQSKRFQINQMLENHLNFSEFPLERASAAFAALSCSLDTGFIVDPLSIEKQQTCLAPAQRQKLQNSRSNGLERKRQGDWLNSYLESPATEVVPSKASLLESSAPLRNAFRFFLSLCCVLWCLIWVFLCKTSSPVDPPPLLWHTWLPLGPASLHRSLRKKQSKAKLRRGGARKGEGVRNKGGGPW